MHHANTAGRISSVEKMVRQFSLGPGMTDLNRTAVQTRYKTTYLFLAQFHQSLNNAG